MPEDWRKSGGKQYGKQYGEQFDRMKKFGIVEEVAIIPPDEIVGEIKFTKIPAVGEVGEDRTEMRGVIKNESVEIGKPIDFGTWKTANVEHIRRIGKFYKVETTDCVYVLEPNEDIMVIKDDEIEKELDK